MRGFLARTLKKFALLASIVPVLALGPSLVRAPVTLFRKLAVRVPVACAELTPRHGRLIRMSGPHVRLAWKAPKGAHPLTYRVLRSGHTVAQTRRTSMVVAARLHHRTTFTVQARYAKSPRSCAIRLSSSLAFRPPGVVRGLHIVSQTAGSLTMAWQAATRGDGPLTGYRILRDGAVVGQSHATTYTLRVSGSRAHRITVAAVDSRGHLGTASEPILLDARQHASAPLATRQLKSTPTPAPVNAPTPVKLPSPIKVPPPVKDPVPVEPPPKKEPVKHPPPDETPPSTPAELSAADIADESATVMWTASKAGGAAIDGYRVYRDGLLVTQTDATARSLRLTHLSTLREYEITVSAIDHAHHESQPSPPLDLLTTHTPPQGPSLLSAIEVTDTSATLSWDAGQANSGSLVGYLLLKDDQPVGVIDAQEVTVALASAQSYKFTVRAQDSLGYLSAPTPELTVLTTHTPPSTPTDLTASQVSYNSATVTWSPSIPVSGRIVGYRVFRDEIPVGQTEDPEFTLSTLAPSSDYHITVAAVDSLGAISPPTEPLLVHTDDPPPTHGSAHAFLLASTDQSFEDFQAHYQQIGVVYPTYFDCDSEGAITGKEDPLVTHWAQARKVEVLPRLNCQRSSVEHRILTDIPTREHLIDQLAELCETYGYDGIQIDFEAAPASDRGAFTAFITELAARLHAQGRKLSTIVTAKYYDIHSGRAAMYDDAALSVPSDYIFVLDWGLHWTTSGPGGMDEMAWWRKVAEYTAKMPNLNKFILGMPLYGIDWAAGGGSGNPGTPLEYSNIMALAAQYSLTPLFDPVAQDPYFNYTDENGVGHSVWYTDRRSVSARLDVMAQLGLGVGVWHLGSEDQSVWELPGMGGGG